MKIFITGANGFIGRHVVTKALNEGHKVVALSFSNKDQNSNNSTNITWVQGSLEDDLRYAISGCDAMVHLAAYGVDPRYDSWEEAFRWNVNASLKILKDAHELNVRRIIFIGSCSEYGKSAERYDYIPCDAPLEPVNSYGASKAAGTLAAMAYARQHNLEVAVLRLFHVYGEGEGPDRFWPSLIRAAINEKDFAMTMGEQIRDFTPVEFVANSIIEIATKQSIKSGEPIIKNIGMGRPKSLLSFANEIWLKNNAKGKLLPGEINYRDNEIMRYVPDINK